MICHADYTIQQVEYGIIPMTDIPVINIGTAGGMTRASTGYTLP